MIRNVIHRNTALRALVLGCGLALALAACATDLAGEPRIVSTIPPRTPEPTAPPTMASANVAAEDVGFPAARPQVATGASVFAQNCTRCHGANGSGNGELVAAGSVPYPGDMTDRLAVAADTPAQWFNIITVGNLENLMPPWAGSLTEAERWAATMYTYTLSYAPEQINNGEALFEAHFADFDGLDFTDQETMVATSDQQIYDELAAAAPDKLTEDQLWDAVAYARTISLDRLIPDGSNVVAEGEQAAPPEVSVANVTGEIINGTAGANVPDDLTVSLYVFGANEQGQMQMLETLEAPAEAGSYTFPDVEINPDNTYVVATDYRERQFIGPLVPGSAAQANGNLNMPLELYELTEDSSVLQINRMVIQVTAEADRLQVVQVAFLENTSDRMFTSAQPLDEAGTQYGSAVMFLPPGSAVAGFSEQNRYIVSEEDFAVIDTQPVLPGEEHAMQVAYFIPYDNNSAVIEHPLAYPIEGSVRLLTRPTGIELNTGQFEALGEVNLNGNLYGEYGAEVTLSADDVIRYEISGNAAAQSAPAGAVDSGGAPGYLTVISAALFAVSGVSALAAAVLFVRGRDDTSLRDKQIEALVTKIANIDNAHETGALNHDVWHRQRDELKAQLRDLMQDDASTEQATAANQKQVDALVAKIAELDDAHDTGTLTEAEWQQQRDALKAQLRGLMQDDNE